MNFKEMAIEELEARKAAIGTEIDGEGADLDALQEEIRSINEELEARKAEAAKRAEIRQAVAAGEGEVVKTFTPEVRKEVLSYSFSSSHVWM